jgi:hypothetical protein
MSRPRSLQELLTDVADRLDVPAFTATTFVSSSTMTRWINQSVRRFAHKLIHAFGSEYYAALGSIVTAPNVALYPLPADFYQLIVLRVLIDGTEYGITHAGLDDLATTPNGDGWSAGVRPRFRQLNNGIAFFPTPTAVYNVAVLYVPTLLVTDSLGVPKAELVAPTDLLEGHNGWEEWVILDCVKKHRIAEEKEVGQDIAIEQLEISREITRAANARTREPERVRDTYRRGVNGP